MSFFSRLRISFLRFMNGRYGTDTLNRHLLFAALGLAVINLPLRSFAVSTLEWVLIFLVFFRMFSKDLLKRRRENARYYSLLQKVKLFFRHISYRFRERKTMRFFKCPHCKAPIKMPCQKCKNTFTKEFK